MMIRNGWSMYKLYYNLSSTHHAHEHMSCSTSFPVVFFYDGDHKAVPRVILYFPWLWLNISVDVNFLYRPSIFLVELYIDHMMDLNVSENIRKLKFSTTF